MESHYTIELIVLFVLTLAAFWTIMTRSLIRSAIALALTSVILTIMMFRLDSWLAAAFELSVCAGLISVVFISTISLTEPLTQEEVLQHMKDRLQRFRFLPLLIIVVGLALLFLKVNWNVVMPAPEIEGDVRKVLWNIRELDLLGQVIIILAGTFGVVVLFKEMGKK